MTSNGTSRICLLVAMFRLSVFFRFFIPILSETKLGVFELPFISHTFVSQSHSVSAISLVTHRQYGNLTPLHSSIEREPYDIFHAWCNLHQEIISEIGITALVASYSGRSHLILLNYFGGIAGILNYQYFICCFQVSARLDARRCRI